MSESICIEDFCGGGRFPCSFSADYYPAEKLTYFSGDWSGVPVMPSDTEPSNDDVWAWAKKHHGYATDNYEPPQSYAQRTITITAEDPDFA